MDAIEFRNLYQGTIAFNKDDKVIEQLNTECKYVHLERISNEHYWIGFITGDNLSKINLHFKSDGKRIKCTAEFEKNTSQSFPFAEDKK